MQTLDTTHWWFLGRRHVLAKLLGGLALPDRAKILEAGCGVGGNIEMLTGFGNVVAFEPDGSSREYVASRMGLEPVEGYLPDRVPFEPASFDAVCAFDVVEHVDDDRGAVATLAGLVAPGGYLIVTVPAYQWMWSSHDEVHHHVRRYSRREIDDIVRAAGIEPVRSSYFNAILFPLAAVVRFTKRLARLDTSDDRLPSGPLNSVLKRLFSVEAKWLERHNLPFGLSIIIIARRPAAEASVAKTDVRADAPALAHESS
jgi:SAM-dependent methyltransferase